MGRLSLRAIFGASLLALAGCNSERPDSGDSSGTNPTGAAVDITQTVPDTPQPEGQSVQTEEPAAERSVEIAFLMRKPQGQVIDHNYPEIGIFEFEGQLYARTGLIFKDPDPSIAICQIVVPLDVTNDLARQKEYPQFHGGPATRYVTFLRNVFAEIDENPECIDDYQVFKSRFVYDGSHNFQMMDTCTISLAEELSAQVEFLARIEAELTVAKGVFEPTPPVPQ